MKFNLLFLLLLCFFSSCSNSKKFSTLIIKPVLEEQKITETQKEIDGIYTLLVYSLVYDDWQPDSIPRRERRGYNIGALLVDKDKHPVHFDLNCINSLDNATQHGEVRAITGYIEKEKCFNLSGFTIYTTLEPCVMCAGMITMTSVDRAVFGQRDVQYSKAFERLAIDTRPIGGFPPYPRRVLAQSSHLSFAKELDQAYQDFLENDEEKYLAKFLASDTAREIYKKASETFFNYKVLNDENTKIYEAALSFYKKHAQNGKI